MEKLQQLSLRIHEIVFGMCLESLGGSQSLSPPRQRDRWTNKGPSWDSLEMPHLCLWAPFPKP